MELMNLNSQPLTMSSREIAELVESRHDNVKRAIERCAERGAISLPPLEEVKIQRERREETATAYVFSGEQGRRDSIIVVAQLCPEFTARLVDRWMQLESQRSLNPAKLSRLQLIELAMQAEQERLELANLVETMKPDVDAFSRLTKADGSLCITDAAKALDQQPKRLFDYLQRPLRGQAEGRRGGKSPGPPGRRRQWPATRPFRPAPDKFQGGCRGRHCRASKNCRAAKRSRRFSIPLSAILIWSGGRQAAANRTGTGLPNSSNTTRKWSPPESREQTPSIVDITRKFPEKRTLQGLSGGVQVLDNLQEILSSMQVASRSENRAVLKSDAHRAAIALTWHDKAKTWLLSAYRTDRTGPIGTISTTANAGDEVKSRLDEARSSRTSAESLPQNAENSNKTAAQFAGNKFFTADRVEAARGTRCA